MSEGLGVNFSFNTKDAQREINDLTKALKQTQTEFRITDTAMKSSGSSLDKLSNKYNSLKTQVKQQEEITKKYSDGLQKLADKQTAAKKRLDEANAAYSKHKNEVSRSAKGTEEYKKKLEELKQEVQKAEKGVTSAGRAYDSWNNKLSKSSLEEAKLKNELKQTSDELKKQAKYITQVQQEYNRLQEKTSGVRSGLTNAGRTLTATVTAPIVAAGAAAYKQYQDLNKDMANIGTLSVEPARLKELKTGVQEVAIDVGKYTHDIADGVYQVISAFGDTADTLKITEINAKSARAGLSTTTDAINLTSAVTKGYGDTTAEAVEYASDLAFKTVELGQTTFPELANSMGKVIPQSVALGVSQEELFATFATLTGVTGKASEVSTQLGAVYTSLMTPSENMKKKLKELGYESGFAMVKSLGLAGTLDLLTESTGGSEEALTALFGSKEAITAMLALTGTQADTFAQKLEKMGNAAGTTEKAFKAQSEGVNKSGFEFEQAMVKMQVSAQKFGEAAAPFIDKTADAISGLTDYLSQLSDDDINKILGIAGALAALGPALSLSSKGISVVNGVRALTSGLGKASTAAAATEAAATGAATATAATGAAATGAATGLGAAAAAAAPLIIALAAIAAAAGIGVYAYKKHQEALINWSEGMDETTQEMKDHMTAFQELNDLQFERRELVAKINTDGISTEELEQAQKRIQEIDALLEKKYKLEIDVDDSQLDKAIEKQKQYEMAMSRGKQAELENTIVAKKQNFEYGKERIAALEAEKKSTQDTITKTYEQATALQNLKNEWDKLSEAEQEAQRGDFTKKLNDIQRAAGVTLSDSFSSEAVGNWADNAAEAVSKLKDKIADIEAEMSELNKSSDEYKNSAKELADINVLGIELGDADGQSTAENISKISTAVKNAGLSATEYAQKTALAQSGLKSFNDVVAQGGTTLDDYISNYISNGQEFGAATQDLSAGAALLKEGFTSVEQAAKAGALDKVFNNFKSFGEDMGLTNEQIASFANELNLIPSNKHIEINAEGDVELIDNVTKKVVDLGGKKYTVKIDANGNVTLLDKVTNQTLELQGLGAVSIFVDAQGNTVLLDEAGNKVGELKKYGDVRVAVTANGDVTLLDTADEALKELMANQNLTFKMNAKGDINVLDEAHEKIATIKQDGTVEIELEAKDNASAGMSRVEKLAQTINGKTAEVTLKANGTPATATIDGVTYKVGAYDKTTGTATLYTDNGVAIAVLNTSTNKVQGFDRVTGTAKIKADGSAVDAEVSRVKKLISNIPPGEARINVKTIYKTEGESNWNTFKADAAWKASGTKYFEGGPAVINDQEGVADPRELVIHNGKGYIFDGKDVPVNLDKGDKIYTAAQTKKMLEDLPHFASGVNNEAFENKKADFEYRQKTSIVTDAEALLWWQNILKEFAKDTEVVKEANIEIYELTNKINDDAIDDYKKRLQKQESNSQEWIDHEIKMRNLSTDEQIAAYQRMDNNYLATLQDMVANTQMTEEQLAEVWDEYYATLREHEERTADLRKKNLEEENDISSSWTSDRTYFNDWGDYDDDPLSAYNRVKERNLKALQEGKITEKEFEEIMKKYGEDLYEGRRSNSGNWMSAQKKYGNLSAAEELAGLERVKKYTEQYGAWGIIQGQKFAEAMDDINGQIFDAHKSMLEASFDEYYKNQQKMLDTRKKEIEDEYDAEEAAEKKADRKKEREDLTKQYEKYKNAVTIDGKKKLEEIKNELADLEKEELHEKREEKKKADLAEIDELAEELEKQQETALNGIDKYTASALGIIDGGNAEMTKKFNQVISSYNQQQAKLAQTGYETICKIVDMTNAKLSEVGNTKSGDTNVTINQTFNNNINDETSAAAYGKYAVASARNTDWAKERID